MDNQHVPKFLYPSIMNIQSRYRFKFLVDLDFLLIGFVLTTLNVSKLCIVIFYCFVLIPLAEYHLLHDNVNTASLDEMTSMVLAPTRVERFETIINDHGFMIKACFLKRNELCQAVLPRTRHMKMQCLHDYIKCNAVVTGITAAVRSILIEYSSLNKAELSKCGLLKNSYQYIADVKSETD